MKYTKYGVFSHIFITINIFIPIKPSYLRFLNIQNLFYLGIHAYIIKQQYVISKNIDPTGSFCIKTATLIKTMPV